MWSPRVALIPMMLADIMLRSRYLMKSKLNLTKITYPNMGYSNTMGFRVTMGDNMYLCAVGQGKKTMLRPLEVYLRFKKPNPHLQRHMLFPRLTLIPMVLEDIILWSRYLMKSKPGFIKETS